MKIVVTNPSMPSPLIFTLNPHNTIETLRLRIDIETSLKRDGYALLLGDRELQIDETLHSLLPVDNDRKQQQQQQQPPTLVVALVLRIQSGFIL